MTVLKSILPFVQIGLAFILILSIVLQQSGAGIGGALGGSDGTLHHTRRGLEKFLFYFTMVIGFLFAISALLPLFIK